QLKRLGGPNFTHIPVNAPKCPVRHFQQDGHMAMRNPKGRVNYEPNSWDGGEHNPRACPAHGFVSSSQAMGDSKLRYRSPTFADHYSQARQFYISQTAVEQEHIQSALIFELSKVENLPIRQRVVSHLLNID
ncbi:catalase-related domain-containing protein, partial [Bacillus sp. SIMBA_074]